MVFFFFGGGYGLPCGSDSKKNPTAREKTWARSLGWEDVLEKERLPTSVLLPG